MITNEMECPCCGGQLINQDIVIDHGNYFEGNQSNVWSCEDCPVILLEYFGNDIIKDLGGLVKES
jgi:C4-type Zn-finger protein